MEKKDTTNVSLKELLSKQPESCNSVSAWFSVIGKELMCKWDVLIGEDRYALAEIEFYLHREDHPDPYVHKTKLQLDTAVDWYFHREKSASKRFTLKGIDLTFGIPGKEYGGILIRAL